MNCLIQSGPGETHILDTSVLYIHIKYTIRIQILSDNNVRVGTRVPRTRAAKTARRRKLICSEIKKSLEPRDCTLLPKTGPRRTKKTFVPVMKYNSDLFVDGPDKSVLPWPYHSTPSTQNDWNEMKVKDPRFTHFVGVEIRIQMMNSNICTPWLL